MASEFERVDLCELQYVIDVKDATLNVRSLHRPPNPAGFDRFFYCFGSGATQQFPDRSWKIEAGDLIYIPASTAYTDFYDENSAGKCILAVLRTNFGDAPFRLSFGEGSPVGALWERLLDRYDGKRLGWYCGCMKLLYEIAEAADRKRQSGYGGSSAKNRLAPAVEYLTAQFRDPDADVSTAAAACDVSYSRFRSLFHDAYGMSAKDYLTRLRLERARLLLTESALSVADVAAECGFRDVYYFSAAFKKATGKSPTAYRSR